MREDDFLRYQQAMGLFYFGRYITDPRPQPGIPTLPDIDPSPSPEPTPSTDFLFSTIDKGGEMITSPKELTLVSNYEIGVIENIGVPV